MARLVETMGAQELCERLRDDVDLAGLRSDAAERLAAWTPQRARRGRSDGASGSSCRGTPSGPRGSTTWRTSSRCNGLFGPPLGLWVRGPARSPRSPGPRWRSWVRAAPPPTAPTSPASSPPSSAPPVTVVSGAAFGIDKAAHRGALAVGPPRSPCSPAASTARTRRRTATCSSTSRSPASSSPRPRPAGCPTKVRFLSRNRLIAALTSGTVVVEAAVRSGALNTATWAEGLKRVVMGVPGPVDSAPSAGVHQLLRSGAAHGSSPAVGTCSEPCPRQAPPPGRAAGAGAAA